MHSESFNLLKLAAIQSIAKVCFSYKIVSKGSWRSENGEEEKNHLGMGTV